MRFALSAAVLIGLVATAFGAYYRVFLLRAVTYPFKHPITRIDWYKPLETVPGMAVPRRLYPQTAAPTEISQAALQNVLNYAKQSQTSALVVVHKGEVVLEHIFADRLPFGRTNSMSMAKTVLGLLVGIAIDEGKIRSDEDYVWQYLPESSGQQAWKSDPHRRDIKLRHLMEMTSGLIFNDNANSLTSDISWMHATDDLVPFIIKTPGDGRAGERFTYNNINAEIMGLVLEQATGVRYAQYLSQKLWGPLGASDADIWLDRKEGMAKTYCCLLAQPHDWALVGQLLLDHGRVGQKQIVPASWISKMTKPSERDLEYGYFMSLGTPEGTRRAKDRSEGFVAPDLFYIDGKAKQRVYIIPSEKLVIVRVGENPAQWDDSILPNVLTRDLLSHRSAGHK